MKRGRKARVSCTTSKGGKQLGEEQNTTYCGLPITELPRSISVDILLRLPANRLLSCKCVCKTWRYIISDPEFAKLHFAKGEVIPLIRSSSPRHVSRTLYLVEPPIYTGRPYRDCSCYTNLLPCEVHRKKKLDAKIKIPLRNSDLALTIQREEEANTNQSNRGGSKRKRCIKLRAKDHRFNLANTCHGLLCLSEPIENDPVAVCNPITGEYLNLPIPTQDKDKYRPWVECALGFSPQTNRYKVIRMFNLEDSERQVVEDPIIGQRISSCRVVEINTLGTSTWKRIGHVPLCCDKLRFPTYLNGALHWLYADFTTSNCILSLDLVGEKFQRIEPPWEASITSYHSISLGVLSGCLSMYYHDYPDKFVWMMEEYGVKTSWTKKYRVDTTTPDARWLRGLHEPICVSSNGDLLFFHHRSSALLIYNLKGMDFEYIKFRGVKSKYQAIAFAPSFISLKELVAGQELEVPNLYSRCAGLKLLGETKTIYSEEADTDLDSDLNPSSDSDSGADDCESS